MRNSFYQRKYYKKYLLAYLDIMGFKDKIQESIKSREEQSGIYQLLSVHDYYTKLVNKEGKQHFPGRPNSIAFSDNIVINIEGFSNKLFNQFIHVITFFQWQTIDFYSFLRGAIVYDNHYQDKRVFFGPAIVRAYEMEKNDANWPRVIIDNEIINKLSPNNKRYLFKLALTKDAKGIVFIDYLRYIFIDKLYTEATATVSATKPVEEISSNKKGDLIIKLNVDLLGPQFVFKQHKSAIWEGIRSAEKKPDIGVIKKLKQVTKYHNDTIDKLCSELSSTSALTFLDIEAKQRYLDILMHYKIDIAHFFNEGRN